MRISIYLISFLYLSVDVLSNPLCPELKEGMTNVHLVCHTHDDVGWLKTVDQYYYGSRKSVTLEGVQYILDSVVPSLIRDPKRKFIYAESAFLFRWWNQQSELMKNDVKNLLETGQLEIIGGGWCQNDEATTYYDSIIDQMTFGLSWLNATFGAEGIPRIAWQIDPFGHSKEQASLFAQMGFDGLFVSRLASSDESSRYAFQQMEMVWDGSKSLGEDASLFTGVLRYSYSPPTGFCFDILCRSDPIMDDPYLEDYNVDQKVQDFLYAVSDQQKGYQTSNIMMTMGGDFQYTNAEVWYKNLDKLIKYVNDRQVNGSNVNLVYSTPSCYLDALHDADMEWPIKTDDFFPYASDKHSYWTGYFTSRPTLKGYTKQCNNILQVVKQMAALNGTERGPSIEKLSEAMAVLQHHDAITGTAKQHVTNDYARILSEGVDAADQLLKQAFSNQASILSNVTVDPSEFEFCPLLNISSCSATEQAESFVVNAYNPIVREISFYVRIPVANNVGYQVTDTKGASLEVQMVPLPEIVTNIPGRNSSAKFELIFYAQHIPPLGGKQYLVERIGREESHKIKAKFLSSTEDSTFEKGNIRLTLDAKTKSLKALGFISQSTLENVNVSQNWLMYEAMIGTNMYDEYRASGAYIFRPRGNASVIGEASTEIYSGSLVTEIHQEWASWVTQVMRLYDDKNYIEIEWLVGPIPIDDETGKEIVTRFQWEDIDTNGTFYTDANGREMQKRIKDVRQSWEFTSSEPVSQNYYPVTSRLILESVDREKKIAILNDRSQGGTSLNDGQMELMVHRRLLCDDGLGVEEELNEIAFGEGLVARGRHFLIHSDLDDDECDFGCQHRSLGEELLLQPILYFSPPSSFAINSTVQPMNPVLATPLSANMRLLTLEPWGAGQWLLRLENFYEIDESSNSGNSTVDLQNLFTSWNIDDIRELTLGANQLKEDNVRLQWKREQVRENHHNAEMKQERETREQPLGEYSFTPMQIRTFVVKISQK